jgi:hypothetical protein
VTNAMGAASALDNNRQQSSSLTSLSRHPPVFGSAYETSDRIRGTAVPAESDVPGNQPGNPTNEWSQPGSNR